MLKRNHDHATLRKTLVAIAQDLLIGAFIAAIVLYALPPVPA